MLTENIRPRLRFLPSTYARREIMQNRIAALTLLALVITASAFAQSDKSKRPSPPESASCDLGGGRSIKIDYSSPRMKGRKIFGDLVPYGQVWRTGANEATTFDVTGGATVGVRSIVGGNYTIFTIPNQDKWTLIINKKTGEWGIPYKYESDELGRVEMKVSQLPSPVEDFTIGFDKIDGGCRLHMDWETTSASIDIAAK
jgi:hypothetical protein